MPERPLDPPNDDLLRKADELVELATEVRDDMRRVTLLYEEREHGTEREKRRDVQ